MKKLEIVSIDRDEVYTLKDKDNTYKASMYFYDVEKEPSVEDSIYIDDKALSEKIDLRYSNLDSTYGRKITREDDEDILILIDKDQKKYVYKRIYG